MNYIKNLFEKERKKIVFKPPSSSKIIGKYIQDFENN